MSLYIPSDGIRGSYVKREIVEKAMSDREKENYLIEEIEPLGAEEGTTSLMAVTTFKSDKNTRKTIVKLPVCQKLTWLDPESEAGKRHEDWWREVHNREMRFYSDFSLDNLLIPGFFGGKLFSEKERLDGFLILDWIEDTTVLEPYQTAGLSGTKLLIEAIAKVHSKALDSSFDKDAYDADFMVELYGAFMFGEQRLSTSLTELGEFVNYSNMDQLRKTVQQMVSAEQYFNLCEKIGCSPVLAHGDLWAGNVLWKKGDDGVLYPKAIVDWQVVRLGSAADDLAKIFMWALTPEERKTNRFGLLQFYYETLLGIVGDEKRMPFTLQQLVSSYYHVLPIVAMVCVPYMPGVFKKATENLTEQENAGNKQRLIDNIRSILDEILECSEKIEK